MIPYEYLVSLGKQTGMEAIGIGGRTRNSYVGDEVWYAGGKYNFLFKAEILKIYSTANEDHFNGIGGKNLLLDGLDKDGYRIYEIVKLEGREIVKTTQEFLRVNAALIITAGKFGSNVGNIIISTDNNIIQSAIEPGKSKDSKAIYTVPRGHKLIIGSCYMAIHCENGAKSIGRNMGVDYCVRIDKTNTWITNARFYATDISQTEIKPSMLPPSLPELTDIKFTIGSASDDGVEVSLACLGYLFDMSKI